MNPQMRNALSPALCRKPVLLLALLSLTVIMVKVVMYTLLYPQDDVKRMHYNTRNDNRRQDTDTNTFGQFSLKAPKTLIPKIIHQTYKSDQIPLDYKHSIQTCLRTNQGWAYMFWSDEDGLALVRDKYPKYLGLFRKYQTYPRHRLLRADALRYFILHHYGGLFLDMDFDCLKPIDQLLANHSCVMTPEIRIQSYALYRMYTLTSNAAMATVPGHAYFSYIINNLHKFMTPGRIDVLYITGPVAIHRMLEQFVKLPCQPGDNRCQVKLIDPSFLNPTADPFYAMPIITRFYRNRCLRNRATLVGDEKRVCKWVNSTNFNNSIPKQAYANHRWMHLEYKSDFRGQTIPVADVVKQCTNKAPKRYTRETG